MTMSDNKTGTLTDHVEDGFTHEQSTATISYDNKGISGIIRSPYVFGAALLASFGGFSFGYDQGVVSLILTLPQFHAVFPEVAPGHARYGFNTGFMTGMLEFGAFVGCIFFPMLADRFSRKTGLAVATVFFCVGAVIQTASHSYGTLVAGRTVGGVGVGTLAMGAPEFKQWGDLFKPSCIRRTIVALAIPFFQQFSGEHYCTAHIYDSDDANPREGINAFVYYAPIFFAALGQSYEMSLILSGMVNVCQFVAGIPTFLFLDKMGRRKLAIFGGIAMGIPHIIMAGIVSKYNGKWENDPGIGWFGVALLRSVSVSPSLYKVPSAKQVDLYVLAYASSYGPLASTLPAEVFPSSKRAKGVGAATAMVWLANFIIGVIVPEMQLKLGWGTYLFFGCFCFAASVFSFFFVPETAGKSLEQIAGVFGDDLGDEERELETQGPHGH